MLANFSLVFASELPELPTHESPVPSIDGDIEPYPTTIEPEIKFIKTIAPISSTLNLWKITLRLKRETEL
ncbi:MAG: hypothetical protein SPL05_00300 [Eubacteriales bacterium]|nr:hypothetical protein [Eubacteriales bacterium]